jgi:hypothetical protein
MNFFINLKKSSDQISFWSESDGTHDVTTDRIRVRSNPTGLRQRIWCELFTAWRWRPPVKILTGADLKNFYLSPKKSPLMKFYSLRKISKISTSSHRPTTSVIGRFRFQKKFTTRSTHPPNIDRGSDFFSGGRDRLKIFRETTSL